MASLLETALTFVATMLLLALAAQSLQDLTKFVFAIKARTRLTAVRRLLRESASTAGLGESDGDAIVQQVVARLAKLSQNGVLNGLFQTTVRLDVIEKKGLMDLVRAVDPQKVAALRPLAPELGRGRLGDVASEVEKWFELALEPVTERYRRRMRLGALASGALVVLVVNANAFDILQRARSDPRFRAGVQQQAAALWSADSLVRSLEDSARTKPTAGLDSLLRKAVGQRDSLAVAVVRADTTALFGYPKHFVLDARWVGGILIAALLVGLGAPFWHDVLEIVLGWKQMARGNGSRATPTTP
jgi:hypothetical protein